MVFKEGWPRWSALFLSLEKKSCTDVRLVCIVITSPHEKGARMPRKNFYVADADVPVYEKAKDYIGDSISGFIMDALKKLVHDKEDIGKELTPIRLWVGKENEVFDVKTGEYIGFTGRFLGSGTVDGDSMIQYELYETRKGNFLLYIVEDDKTGTITSAYDTYKEYPEVTKLNLPSKLLKEAEATLRNFKCVELDI